MPMQVFHTQFTLSREYLAECFDQSLPHGKSAKANYLFAILSFSGGAALLFYTDQPKVVGTLLIALAVLELIHIRFRRAWWLTRQVWSKSANTEVKLRIDGETIQTQNPYTKTSLLWADIERVVETDLGLILVVKTGGQQYLSKALFSDEMISSIISRCQK
jgi:hypothetical protein